MKLITIVQARLDSARFPGKVLKKYKEISLLEILIKRLQKSKKIGKIIVATSINSSNKEINELCIKLNIYCYQGSETDLTDRYYKVARLFKSKNIIRVTGDCPLIDPKVIDKVIEKFFLDKADYATNTMPPTYPDGLDIEIFNFKSLEQAWKSSRKIKRLREHVTTYMRESKRLKKINLKYKKDYSFLRLTIDEPLDLKVIKDILKNFTNIYNFGIDELIQLYKKNKSLFKPNMRVKRNEGQHMNTGQKLWKRAKQIIPGGTMLFSKNPDLFLPDKWPAYFSKTKGCKVWDLDGKSYNDISYMGVGTNTLGYNFKKVEEKVIEAVKNGTMSTLNCQEEILLAEKIIEIHPWADMAKFTRSGGEANAVAIRIARAASGRDKVAVCGYHGWHDWYLSANIRNRKNLDELLMKNVPIKGVPKNLSGTIFPFEYNNFESLKKITDNYKIGTIKMEVKRNHDPKNKFLEKVRKLATEKSIILIFDECTSGFREAYGGLHKIYNICPDMAIFGKALGNGYAINSIIGKRSIMEACTDTFISSTFWTERIGFVAGLETLKSMERLESWNIITKLGKKIKKNWKKISKIHDLKIDVMGLDAIPNFSFKSNLNLHYKTFISQEMLKKKFLAANTIFCSIAHKDKIIDDYFNILDDIFLKIKKCRGEKKNIEAFLETKLCLEGLRNKAKYKND